MPIYLRSGLAEFFGALLLHIVGALLGSAVTAVLTTAATAIAVLSTLHGLGLSLAVGSDRLRHKGHWLLRPLLFTLGFAVLAFGSLCSNVVLIGRAVMDEGVSWWMMLAPASAFLVQVASGLIVGLWGIDRLARIIGDYLVQLGVGSGERGLWWRRSVVAARWAGTAMWGIAAVGLTIGSLMGVVLTVPLFAAGDGSTIVALLGHGALMLFGLAAGGVLLTTRLARLRSGDRSSRDWSARIRGRTRDGIGKLWQLCLSLFAWLLGEAVLWTSCAGLVLVGLLVAGAMLQSDTAPFWPLLGVGLLPFVLGGLWLARAGGVLRRLDPGPMPGAPRRP